MGIIPTIGIEEEFFISPILSQEFKQADVAAIIKSLRLRVAGRVEDELFSNQVELKSGICSSISEIRRDVQQNREDLKSVSADFNCVAFACGTHPLQDWSRVPRKTRGLRTPAYQTTIGDRMACCGMHIHLGADEDSRFALYNFLRGFLPCLLALTTSSAFWEGRPTGMLSYRSSIFGGLPRGGLPPKLTGEQFNRYIDLLKTHCEPGELVQGHWFIRPTKLGTVEVRIMDVCPRIEDCVAVTALLHCLAVCFLSAPGRWQSAPNSRPRRWLRRPNRAGSTVAPQLLAVFDDPPPYLVAEAIWRVQREGLQALIFGQSDGKLSAFNISDIIALTLTELQKTAEMLGCHADLRRVDDIMTYGTSAQRQLSEYSNSLDTSKDRARALASTLSSVLTDFGYREEELRRRI
ncbi:MULTISPECIES: YbdK family carboxylate-amine ligase [Rhodomicrobium]|uniref:carboxylate-amine ligase n=1 Tax=Rhodomicrobium TaxID=1068 RepID=UPI000B4BD715|nr:MULTISPECIES: YbdK family carboxylate-amine ligase [Rhodomicrobium]